MRNSFVLTVSAVLFGFAASSAIADDNNGLEPPMDLLASQLRDQGYACVKPEKARRDEKASRPNETVWVVTCKGVDYRMTVVPDLAAKIEKLD
ncbi:MAG: hypothetical protein ABWX70_01130 [Hyphomicrobium sp.]